MSTLKEPRELHLLVVVTERQAGGLCGCPATMGPSKCLMLLQLLLLL